jgi:hypothetical protein
LICGYYPQVREKSCDYDPQQGGYPQAKDVIMIHSKVKNMWLWSAKYVVMVHIRVKNMWL